MRAFIPLITAWLTTWGWANCAEMKILVWNRHEQPIITSARGPGNPELVEGEDATVYPGNVTRYLSFGSSTISVNKLAHGITTDDSHIEVNLDESQNRQIFDVSQVDGFSLPIVSTSMSFFLGGPSKSSS